MRVFKGSLMRKIALLCMLALAGLGLAGRLDVAKGGPWVILLLFPLLHVAMMVASRGACCPPRAQHWHAEPREKEAES
ncbi:MAG: hypothetical protein C4555_04525 [Dehalococcoidia bacterium]|jgi:hypothetical protein|nr:MAG: hypothetical protein C4555_04525 [Dehalococcoidia bacterium]